MRNRPALLIATLCACIACALIIPAVHCYFVQIPAEERVISACEAEIADLNVEMNEVIQIDRQIAATKKDIRDLTNIELGRMRYGRLFEKLCNLMPDHVWFRALTVTPDSERSSFYLKRLGGKRWQIAFSGYATGETTKEMEFRLNELINNVQAGLGVPDKNQTAALNKSCAAPDDWGFNRWLGARFDPPRLQNVQYVTREFLEKDRNVQNAPELAVDFKFILNFEMPSASNDEGN